ncbi:hypothetical protein L228DRAFT_267883 [Xylona heveae TC161]|uniref:Altered inheritance of mitochondria protein 21 n=1 Tax=Xylona heveae (strain CBS 132557 / TC161) TaxID=1328760 RepID=A0A165GQW6_XYLHT|nr:hypothetical protein L228DRAFT_267883 [Xylona heveae TC161]KZF22482.1 hypothetical protein L228DRAFT_267883 [Xylona heveae TC161]
MSAPSAPVVPPRPSRSPNPQNHASTSSSTAMDVPKVPPRPGSRRLERSQSPHRASFARSPLHDSPFVGRVPHERQESAPRRPPSISMPSIGQEGIEYTSALYNPEEQDGTPSTANASGPNSPPKVGNIRQDLPLYAPKASHPEVNEKARVAAVTRTDSAQAAAAGIGRAAPTEDDKERQARPIFKRISFSRPESVSTERPYSTRPEDEDSEGQGVRVPMYPNAGFVQAPSPAPQSSGHGTPEGSQRPSRHHGRTRSGREFFHGPPGSYGLHGHGVTPKDKFEKAWYEKHPDELEHEMHGEYGPGIGVRKDWVLSSNDLNKLVHETASRGAGYGTSPDVIGTPDEQIGYAASDEYTARLSSSRSQSRSRISKSRTGSIQPSVESPLRKMSFPANQAKAEEEPKEPGAGDHALESEADDDEVIHIDPPTRRGSKVDHHHHHHHHHHPHNQSTDDLGEQGEEEEGAWPDERGVDTPILASDELAKDNHAEFLQPAVSPQERRGSNYFGQELENGFYSKHTSRGSSIAGSRPTSRPGSIYNLAPGFGRHSSVDDRELEDVEEYEPLFPEEDEKTGQKKPITLVDKLKRPATIRHKFPSQDVWEDAPNSLKLETTVSTPEAPSNESPVDQQPPNKEEPTTAPEDRNGGYHVDILPQVTRHLSKPKVAPHLRNEVSRPHIAHRFPSHDIWEDAPDSLQLQTTVSTPEVPDTESPIDKETRDSAEKPAKPPIPARPAKGAAAPEADKGDAAQVPATIPSRPPQRLRQVPPAEIPPSPAPASESHAHQVERNVPLPAHETHTSERKAPTLPDRPKPQIPARPVRPTAKDNASIVAEHLAAKPKPAVPGRPQGSKISSLKAGFLSDLNKSLQLGPTRPKSPEKSNEEAAKEEEKEPAPLSDARKGRARGPARRKPATAAAAGAGPADATTAETAKNGAKFEIALPWKVWEVSEDGHVNVNSPEPAPVTPPERADLKATKDETPTLATNTEGDFVHRREEISPGASRASHIRDTKQDEHQASEELAERHDLATHVSNQLAATEFVPKASDDPLYAGETTKSQVFLDTTERNEADVTPEDPEFVAAKRANLIDTEVRSPEAVAAASETASPGVTAPRKFSTLTNETDQTGEHNTITITSADGDDSPADKEKPVA